jgi:leucine dehydrogenase
MSSMIAPLLPEEVIENPQILAKEVAPGVQLMIGATGELSKLRPGNGGFRIWKYPSESEAAAEAVALAQGMEVKHMAYNTGCAGAKVVCNIGEERELKDIDKQKLLDELNDMLVSLNGAMYTGCDMNSTLEDMEYLSQKSPYILAAIGNDTVDPNVATASGVVGALIAVLRPELAQLDDGKLCNFNGATNCKNVAGEVSQLLNGKTLLVHGSGAVGSVVAAEAVAMGAKVYTIDSVATRAEIPGCENITLSSKAEAWWTLPVDAIVPCSASGLISKKMVQEMRCSSIVGASNLPFQNAAAQREAEGKKGITFIPEGVTSAGAVIVDSVEQFDQPGFAQAKPDELYAFCRQNVFEKTNELLAMVRSTKCAKTSNAASQLQGLLRKNRAAKQDPIGLRFKTWKEERLSDPVSAAAARDFVHANA